MGIDYGHGVTNIDTETGIRYGIISANLIDISEFEYMYDIVCPECFSTLTDFPEEDDEGFIRCPACDHVTGDPDDFCPDEPSAVIYNQDGYSMRYDPDSNDVWVFKSPWKALAGFCSPCAPGAVYLTDKAEDAYGYCLDKGWFYNEEDINLVNKLEEVIK